MKQFIIGKLKDAPKLIPTISGSKMVAFTLIVSSWKKDYKTNTNKTFDTYFDIISFHPDVSLYSHELKPNQEYIFECELTTQEYKLKLVHKNFMLWSEYTNPGIRNGAKEHKANKNEFDDEIPFL